MMLGRQTRCRAEPRRTNVTNQATIAAACASCGTRPRIGQLSRCIQCLRADAARDRRTDRAGTEVRLIAQG